MRWLVITIVFLFFGQQDEYKWGRPTSKGIDRYVERNEYQFIIDYQNFIGDTLFYEPFISTDDLSKYYVYNEGDAGYFERPDNIIITNERRFIDYELSRLNVFRKSQYREANMFVRSVVMHELTHAYFHQIMIIAQNEKVLEYEFRQGLRMLPVDNYYTEFLEEGICEFVVQDMGESIAWDEQVFLNKNDLSTANRNTYEIKYRYSSQFVKPIIEKYGLKPAILIIVSHKPPSLEEILNPKLYYDRLNPD